MSVLAGAKPQESNEPLMITLAGDAGCGKSTAASTFPAPYIIRTKGEAMPRDAANKPAGLEPIGGRMKQVNGKNVWDENELFEQLAALLKDEHEFKTLIVDSVTGLEDLFVQSVVDNDPKNPKSVVQAAGGYGAGRAAVKSKHMRVKKYAEALREKRGMHVIFLAHVEIDRLDPPDGEPFTRYNLQLHKESAPVYINNVDVVGYIGQERFVSDDGKARSSDDRELILGMTPANISKNRLGISGSIPLKHNVNPFADYI